MTAYNIADYVAGDSLVIELTVRDARGAAVDLTGATIRWGMAPVAVRQVGDPVVTKTVGAGIEVTDAPKGKCRITLGAGDVADPGEYRHEAEITLANGQSYTVLSGTIMARRAIYND